MYVSDTLQKFVEEMLHPRQSCNVDTNFILHILGACWHLLAPAGAC